MELINHLRASAEWAGNPPASEGELQKLTYELAAPVPETLLTLLRHFNGGSGGLAGDRFKVHVLSVDEMLQAQQVWEVNECIPGAILFGTDQGDFGLLLDTTHIGTNGECPIIMCPVSSLSISDSEYLCDSLEAMFNLPWDR